MFSEPENIQANLVGKLDFFQQIFQSPHAFRPASISGVGVDIREGVETEFHVRYLCFPFP